jgi:transposase-like protein
MRCPNCQAKTNQIKFGKNKSGTQKYKCKACQRQYTPEAKRQGYGTEVRMQAVRLYADGMNLRRIARHLKVNHQSVANWVNAYAARLPSASPPETVDIIEMDEVFTFIGEKKTRSSSSRT